MRIEPSSLLTGAPGAGVRGPTADGGIGGAAESGATPADGAAGAGSAFEAAFTHALEDASARTRPATAKVEALAAGTGDDLHGTLISTKEADISLRLVNSVRTKLLDAFHELWRTNV